MALLGHVLVADGDAETVIRRVEALNRAGYAAIPVSIGLDVRAMVAQRQPDAIVIGTGFDDV
ncbi:MAG: hypothetical protein QF654_01445, partial [Alphaproteobacteria bacterium]|nr:hypothetical protein [Alphaproteobacteria bacterium]